MQQFKFLILLLFVANTEFDLKVYFYENCPSYQTSLENYYGNIHRKQTTAGTTDVFQWKLKIKD